MFISTIAKTLSNTPKFTPMVRLKNRTIGVNLGKIQGVLESSKKNAVNSSETPLV